MDRRWAPFNDRIEEPRYDRRRADFDAEPLWRKGDDRSIGIDAKVGTPLMQSSQTIGIDLPLKALAWEDEMGAAHLSYNDPKWLAKRHGIGREVDETLAKMAAILDALTAKASGAR